MSRWCEITTAYPGSNDTFAVPSAPGSTPLASGGSQGRTHSVHHGDLGAAVMALEQNVPLLTHDHSGTGARATNRLLGANTHQSPDTDSGASSLHHTLGPGSFQAASGSHLHAGQYMPVETATYARYWANVTQTLPATTDTVVWFPNVAYSSSLITAAAFGAGTQFTARRAGLWQISTVVRFAPLPAGGGETYIAIYTGGGLNAANGGTSSNAANTRSVAVMDYLPNNTTIYIDAFNGPVSGTAAANTVPGYGWCFIEMCWVHD